MKPEVFKELADIAVPSASVGFIGGLFRIALQPGGWVAAIGTMTVAVTLSTLVGLALHGHVSESWCFAFSGLCGAVAREIGMGLVRLASYFRHDPLAAVGKVVPWVKGDRARRHDSDPLP
jgi:hypothetical protein